MGYDLHGCNPIDCNYENYPTLSKWEDKSWDERRDQMSEEVSDKYWKEMSERDSDTGAYFRANVWWWRELWSFTCGVCFKVMTEDDRRAGDANDGIEITEETCANMVPLMRKAIESKDHEKHEAEVTQAIDEVDKNDNGWPKNEEDWWAMYPFSASFFEQFTTFVERSGGFTID